MKNMIFEKIIANPIFRDQFSRENHPRYALFMTELNHEYLLKNTSRWETIQSCVSTRAKPTVLAK